MTRREKQIAAMLANGLTEREIARKTGLADKTIKNAISKVKQASRCELPNKEVAEEFKRPTRCTQQEGCKCVLCEARWWKWKVKRMNEFGSTSRGPASHDGRVIRQQIGRV